MNSGTLFSNITITTTNGTEFNEIENGHQLEKNQETTETALVIPD
jgi:hypothetical protein